MLLHISVINYGFLKLNSFLTLFPHRRQGVQNNAVVRGAVRSSDYGDHRVRRLLQTQRVRKLTITPQSVQINIHITDTISSKSVATV